VKYLR